MRWGFVLVISGIAGTAGVASADEPAPAAASFDQIAREATVLSGTAGVEALVWPLTAACDQGDDLARRQCRVVRDARVAQVRGETFLVDAEPSAMTVGDWDAASKAAPVALRGCIACATPVMIAGRPMLVVTNQASPTFDGGAPQAAVVHEGTRPFHEETAVARWRSSVVPRLRAQLAVRLPAGNPIWIRDGRAGVAVEVVGFRVYDPCDGSVLFSRPESAKLAAEPKTCGEQVAAAEPVRRRPVEDASARLPAQLSPTDIRAALRPAMEAAQVCFDSYGVAGSATLKIAISGGGKVIALVQDGDFADTPTGACIEKAVRATTFPQTRKKRTTITYPVVLN